MSPIVIDCSVALAWVIPDEATEHSRTVLEKVTNEGAIVPSLWKIETANGLLVASRKSRIDKERLAWGFSYFERLAIETDQATLTNIWSDTFRFAQQYKLTVYDATYLELALRRNLPLATYDQDLRKAATTAGIQLL